MKIIKLFDFKIIKQFKISIKTDFEKKILFCHPKLEKNYHSFISLNQYLKK